MNAVREKIWEPSRWLGDEGQGETRRWSYPHYPVGLTDRAKKIPRFQELSRGENRPKVWGEPARLVVIPWGEPAKLLVGIN
jgi:hypothetical protein